MMLDFDVGLVNSLKYFCRQQDADKKTAENTRWFVSVSYTHLTLPTVLRV